MRSAWMLSAVMVLGVASSGAAHADPYAIGIGFDTPPPVQPTRAFTSAWYDFGLVRSTYTADTIGPVGGSQPIVANTIRFGIGAFITRHLYAGGDTDFGTVSLQASNVLANGRSTVMQPAGYDVTQRGSTAAIRALAGLMARAGSISGAAELAAGYRVATTESNSVMGSQSQENMLVEARAHLALRVSPAISVGAVAGVDLLDHRDKAIGLVVGLHLNPHDHLR